MNRYFTETVTIPAQGTRRNAVMLALTQGMIVCTGACGCASPSLHSARQGSCWARC